MSQQTIFNGSTIKRGGLTFTVAIERDDNMGPPWKEHDGHGPVRQARAHHRNGYSDKRPGERPLNDPRNGNGAQYYYDWQEACRLAPAQWGFAVGTDIARVVQQDFDYLRAWLADEWQWVGVIVTCEETGESESLWGIDGEGPYTDEVARELADTIAARHQHERAEVAYWAARDVMTVGAV